MICSIIPNISFLGCRELTSTITTDFYTGKFVKEKFRSTEHILPKSKGGKNSIKNYAMSDRLVNSERGNMPMRSWLDIHPDYLENMKNYVKKYWDTLILNAKHGEEVNITVKKVYGIDLMG